jgi:hypothetical protein
MDRNESLANEEATDAANTPVENQAADKSYTQSEVDNMIARMKSAVQAKALKPYEELGDIEELRSLKSAAEAQRTEEQLKRGEFEKTLQEMAAKKDSEIQKRDNIIEEYKVNTPLLNAAAKYKSVSPEQVQNLLRNSVRLGESGEAEVIDTSGSVRYDDSGNPLRVEDYVKEWLDSNPHFVQPGAATTNTKSAVNTPPNVDFDLASLDLTKAEHRAAYKQAMQKGIIQ